MLKPKYLFYVALSIFASVGVVWGMQFFQPAPVIVKTIGSVPSLVQIPAIAVYFNHNQATSYTDPYRKIARPGDDLEKLIVDNINQAQSTVDMAVQELRLPKIVQALSDRKKAGIKVRLILENTYNRGWSEFTDSERANFNERERGKYADFMKFADLNGDGKLSQDEINQRDSLPMLKNAQIDWIDDTADGSSGAGLMHHKFTIIDQKTVIIPSANYTMSDIHGDAIAPQSLGNMNNLVKIENSEVAKLFTEEFDLMWTKHLFGDKKPHRTVKPIMVGNTLVEVKFSPDQKNIAWDQTTNGLIGKNLAEAKKSVDMALFVFAEPHLSNILETASDRGVEVKALIDKGFAYRDYSAALDMWGYVSTQDCKQGNKRPWLKPIKTVGVPNLPKGDLLHHKFGLIDADIVITGSHNWSNTANYTNDETLIVIHSQIVGAHYQREFNQLFDNSTLGAPKKIQLQASTTCPSQPISKSRKARKKSVESPED